jgi:hypothetical protein
MMNRPNKPASPFASMGQPTGQHGANANPGGNGWGQQFMQQYGAPPGQMREQWQQFRTDNGFGMGGMGGERGAWREQMQDWRQSRPERPEDYDGRWRRSPAMTDWRGQRPERPQMDREGMIRAWLAQHPRGLLGR